MDYPQINGIAYGWAEVVNVAGIPIRGVKAINYSESVERGKVRKLALTRGEHDVEADLEIYMDDWDEYSDPESAISFFQRFLEAAIAEALIVRPFVYQWFASMRADLVLAAWRNAGLLPHQQLIWKKSRIVLTRCDFLWDYDSSAARRSSTSVERRPSRRRPTPS